MANYRYLFADLLTNQILAELPLTKVQFSQQLARCLADEDRCSRTVTVSK